VWAASEMTYIVSGGALNSTQPTNLPIVASSLEHLPPCGHHCWQLTLWIFPH